MNASSPPPPGIGQRRPRLPVQSVVVESYRLLWRERDELVRLGLLPVLVTFLLTVLEVQTTGAGTMSLIRLLALAPLTLFAVNWHRLVLLGSESVPGSFGLRWESRETRFLVQGALLSLGIGFVLLTPGMAALHLLQQPPMTYAVMAALALAFILLWLRLGLIFPAIAVDHPYRMAQSWRDSAGCGFQFLAAVLVASMPVLIALQVFIELAYGIGLGRAAPYAVLFLSTGASYLSAAVLFTVMSLVFRRLTGWPNSAAPPLASRA